MKILILTIFLILHFYNTNIIGMNLNSFPANDTAYYCYITDAFSEGGENYIKIRLIQCLRGLSAVIEARKDSAADYKIDKVTKDTIWFIPYNFYVVNRDKPEFKLIIFDYVKIFIYSYEVKKRISTDELFNNSFYYINELYDKYTLEKSGETAFYAFEIVIENGKVNIIDQVWEW